MARTRYYSVGPGGKINGGGTDNRDEAEVWLDGNHTVDLIEAEGREEAQRKYIG